MIAQKRQVSYRKKDKLGRWAVHKENTMTLAEVYDVINPDKADRLRNCSKIVARETMPDNSVRYSSMHCCIRLCTVCGWRRSDKVFAQLIKIGGTVRADFPDYRFIYLTLTQENCLPEDLSMEMTGIFRAFSNMTKTKAFKKVVKGYCRSMEVTHNITKDTFHPHLHVILVVHRDYFTSPDYIDHDGWMDMWQTALGVDYPPNVDVRRIKGNLAKAMAETAKYSVKSADYLMPDDWEFTVRTVRLLDTALHNRRFVSFGGVFKEYHKKLNLSDPDGDPNEDRLPDVEPVYREFFEWCCVYRQYREVSLD